MAFSPSRLLAQSYRASKTPSYATGLSASWLLHPWILFAVRALISLYAFVVLFYRIGRWESSNDPEDEGDAGRSFSFFTVLSYWGLAFYFAFAAAHTASFAVRGKAWLENWPGWLRWLHSALYATVTVFPWVVTAVFWAVLAARVFESTYRTWSDISQHALNSVFAFLEILLPASEPHPWIQLIPVIVVLACYLGLAYITHAVQGWYVYSFLDIEENGSGLVAGACIGILVASIVVFVAVRYLIWLRKWVTEKKLGFGPTPGRALRHAHAAEEMKDFRTADSPVTRK